MQIETIVKVIIIFIVVVILVFIPTKGWAIVKSIINYGEVEQVKNTPEDIGKEYRNIFSNFESCLNSGDNGCVCDTKILQFPPGFRLTFVKPNTIGITTKDTSFKISKDINSLNNGNIYCYFSYENDQPTIKSISELISAPETYNMDKPIYLILDSTIKHVLIYDGSLLGPGEQYKKYFNSFLEIEFYGAYTFLDNTKLFYKKDNNICFILKDKLSNEGQIYIKDLPKCSPKPLNS